MATPFQERSPCQTASYPRVRRAFTGKAPCSALSSWRLTTSGSALASQARRLFSRLLTLLMLKVATLTKFLSVPVPLLGLPKRSSRFVVLTDIILLAERNGNPELKRIARSEGRRSPKWQVSDVFVGSTRDFERSSVIRRVHTAVQVINFLFARQPPAAQQRCGLDVEFERHKTLRAYGDRGCRI